MSKLDPYLRSIERFAATGAVLASGQAIVLRFPTGDRAATQVTPHDQLVVMIREVAPPAAYDAIERNQPARFEVESSGTRYGIAVTPRPGAWQITIEGPATAPASGPVVASPPPLGGDMEIERGQYDLAPSAGLAPAIASGSALLDGLTRSARGARATDLYLASGSRPQQRVNGELAAVGAVLDGATLSLELGVIAPTAARAAWTEGSGSAVFTYGDGLGRVRVTLGRDRRGPCAALRLLPDEVPGLDRLNLGAARAWLDGGGLVLVAGPVGAGKTLVVGALVRELGDQRRRVVVLEEAIELVQAGETISQREVGTHVDSLAAGVHAALAESADAIALGAVASTATAHAVVDAVAAGVLVVASIVAPTAAAALERLLAYIPAPDRDAAGAVLQPALVGVIRPVASRDGRRYEVVAGAPRG